MEKRVINSFGTITIPSHMRKELGIDGTVTLLLDVREMKNGNKEIVIRKPINSDDILKKYSVWAEVISRIAECSVALIWNGSVLSMSSSKLTEDFLGKNTTINPFLHMHLKKLIKGGAIVDDPSTVTLLPNGTGNVLAYFKVESGDDSCFFVLVQGAKSNVKRITKAEESRRFQIINDIIDKI